MTTTVRTKFDGKSFVPEVPVNLPVGTVAIVRVDDEPQTGKTALQRLAEALDKLPTPPDSPRDLSAQHDHYLYGTPKRENP